MKKDTRNYPKRQNFEEGGEAAPPVQGRPRFNVDLETGEMKQTGGYPVETQSPEAAAGGGASWATKAQKAKAARRIAQGFVP